jgi:hypothetical protein
MTQTAAYPGRHHRFGQNAKLRQRLRGTARVDYQDAIAAGLGVTEHAEGSRAACEIKSLWNWIESRLGRSERQIPMQMGGFKNRLAAIARYFG